jgi:outer membrane protein assembly factor BamB
VGFTSATSPSPTITPATAIPTATATHTAVPPTPSVTPGSATPTAAAQSVSYQIDAAHTVGLSYPVLTPPLRQRWARDLGRRVSYPLVAGTQAYVAVGDVGGSTLYAVDLQTGADVWGPLPLGSSWAALAYDNGQIFVIDRNGIERALDAQTGAQRWIIQLPNQYMFSSPPSARAGIVYTGGAGSGGTIYAVRESDGALLWTVPVANGDHSSPAVDAAGVYVGYPCQTYDLDPQTGQVLWHRNTGCSGGGGRTPALYNGRVYDRENGVVLDAATGALLGSIGASVAPAFAGNRGFYRTGGTLQAIDLATSAVLWSFAGDGALTSAPIVVNDTVYIGSGGSRLYGLDAATGAVRYTGTLPAPVEAPDEHNQFELTGLSAGSGTLLVPAGTWLVAFTPDTATATSTATSTAPPASATETPTATNTAAPARSPLPSATATGTAGPPPVPTSTASPTSLPSPTPCAISFSDVHPADYFYTPVRALACRGVISGYSDGTFCPTNTTSRAQMVKLVVLGLQVPLATPPPGPATFADMPPGSPFYEVIETAAAAQIVSGYACGGSGEPCDGAGRPYFRPYSNVTRGQLAKIVVIAASITRGWAVINPARPAFGDVPAGSVFYEFVETAYCHSVLSGYTCGGAGEPCPGAYFRPGAQATRGQIAKIVYGAVTASGSCAP